ncbi:ricin B lectin domain-containing protein [Phellopilus nigrolimitatus]|nr:ricin B lectin domain-containing protein [Phellopilus nigrolimitatus]
MAEGIDPGTYTFVNGVANSALDLSGGDSRSIIGFNVHGQGNQQWIIGERDGNNNQTIESAASRGLFLGIEAAPANYTHVLALQSPTKWAIRRDGENPSVWRVFFPGTGFGFDLSNNGDETPGTVIHLWEATAGKNQTWKINRGM